MSETTPTAPARPAPDVRPHHAAPKGRAVAFWLELSGNGKAHTAVEFQRNGGGHRWQYPTAASLERLMSLLPAMTVSVYDDGTGTANRIIANREWVGDEELVLMQGGEVI